VRRIVKGECADHANILQAAGMPTVVASFAAAPPATPIGGQDRALGAAR